MSLMHPQCNDQVRATSEAYYWEPLYLTAETRRGLSNPHFGQGKVI